MAARTELPVYKGNNGCEACEFANELARDRDPAAVLEDFAQRWRILEAERARYRREVERLREDVARWKAMYRCKVAENEELRALTRSDRSSDDGE